MTAASDPLPMPGPPVATADQFRAAMARVAATVHIVTAQAHGRRYGITLTAACSLAADPVSLLVSINRSASIYAPIMQERRLCLNVLGIDHAVLAQQFGTSSLVGQDRFASGSWTQSCAGLPALSDAVAVLDCEVAATMSLGTHTVFGCTIAAIALGRETKPLMYAHRQYTRLSPTNAFLPGS